MEKLQTALLQRLLREKNHKDQDPCLGLHANPMFRRAQEDVSPLLWQHRPQADPLTGPRSELPGAYLQLHSEEEAGEDQAGSIWHTCP